MSFVLINLNLLCFQDQWVMVGGAANKSNKSHTVCFKNSIQKYVLIMNITACIYSVCSGVMTGCCALVWDVLCSKNVKSWVTSDAGVHCSVAGESHAPMSVSVISTERLREVS